MCVCFFYCQLDPSLFTAWVIYLLVPSCIALVVVVLRGYWQEHYDCAKFLFISVMHYVCICECV